VACTISFRQAVVRLAQRRVRGMSSEAARQLGQAPSTGLVASSQADNDKYAEAVRYIFSNADFTSAAKRYQLPQENWARFEALLTQLGDPFKKLKVVHIAGTNGKGTTSALCEAMLRASGARVGLFTSPHLHTFRERIRLNGELVSKGDVVAAMEQVRPAVEAVGYASPFEKLSALALVCFTRAELEWAVMETGVGGRWDCTNHCTPLVCGITRVGLDHMNVLGDTVTTIAANPIPNPAPSPEP
jgi:dihydrofolate synthase/folylpolyglutamate synthase